MAKSQTYDKSARKFHQLAMVTLMVVAYAVGGATAPALVALGGLVMLAGRFWWPADVFRQLAWRVLEPSGVLPRVDVAEDHATRRVARVIGGVALLVGAVCVAIGASLVGWVITALIAAMIFLDGVFDF